MSVNGMCQCCGLCVRRRPCGFPACECQAVPLTDESARSCSSSATSSNSGIAGVNTTSSSTRSSDCSRPSTASAGSCGGSHSSSSSSDGCSSEFDYGVASNVGMIACMYLQYVHVITCWSCIELEADCLETVCLLALHVPVFCALCAWLTLRFNHP